MSDYQQQPQVITVETVFQMLHETTAQVKEMFRETREEFREIKERFKETDEKFKETDEKFKETAERFKETDEKFKETDEKFKEVAESIKESDEKMKKYNQEFREEYRKEFQEFQKELREIVKKTNRSIGNVTSSIGRMVEYMLGSYIIEQFRNLGHMVTHYYRNLPFGPIGKKPLGEIDLLLFNKELEIVIEVKTTLEIKDVRKHIERLEKYRRWINESEPSNKKKIVGAVAGAYIDKNVVDFSHNEGLYVILQSGKAVEISSTPEDFETKYW